MKANARDLLRRVNGLLAEAVDECGYEWPADPDTGTCVSGSKGGSGDGGFRLADSKTGAPKSAHKQAQGVDVFDPGDKLDNWISRFDQPQGINWLLERHGLYREAPGKTAGWCHLQSIQPGSGRRTFYP